MVPKAERRLGVEEQAKKWAQQRRERLLSHPPSEAIRVTTPQTLEVFRYPPLVKEDQRRYTVRFNPFTGEIRIPIWRGLPVIEEEGRRFLENPDKLVQIRRRGEHQVDFFNLPPREVVQLYYLKIPGIEAAIRQQVHIMDKYRGEGKEVSQIEDLMNWLNLQWQATAPKIDKSSLTTLAEQTAEFLITSGFATDRDQTKKRIADTLRRVYQPDSLGRINPLVARICLRSAYLEAVRKEMLAVLVAEKFGSFLGILLMEREITRQIMAEAAETLDTMVRVTKRGAVVFEQVLVGASGAELQGINKVLEEVAKSLARVRVLPYLPVARVAAINLVGCREEKKEPNRQIIGPLADTLFSFPPVTELIELRYFSKAKKRIIDWSYRQLRRVLEENKEIGVEV